MNRVVSIFIYMWNLNFNSVIENKVKEEIKTEHQLTLHHEQISSWDFSKYFNEDIMARI